MRARGRTATRVVGRMNKTEARFALTLEADKRRGEIAQWWFEPIKLRLADSTYYSPDFLILKPDGLLSFVEVKGFWRDDARVKIKVAAETYPCFPFYAATEKRGVWHIESFDRAGMPD